MKITEIVDKSSVLIPLKATDKIDAITQLVDALAKAGRLSDRDEVLRAVLAREDTRSTGIGEGLAVPHGKCHGCSGLVMALGKAEPPVDFGSPDGQPCTMLMLLASPVDRTGPHIQALARISRLWLSEDFRGAVANATAPHELYGAIERHQD